MSIIVNGKEYPDEKSVPEQYRMYGDSRTRERDPGNFSPDLAPNVGRTVLPHVTTFSGMMSTLARTYRQHDEAIRHNKQNANMMRRDPMIMGPLFARQMAVALLQWQIQPEDSSDEKQCQVAKELTFMVCRIPRFREYLRNLMEAVWYGRYAIQNVWGFTRNSNGVRYRSVVDWVPVNGDKLLFRYDDGTGRFDHDEIGVKVSVAHVKNDVWAGRPDIEWNSEGTGVFLRRWERSRLVVHKNFMMDGDYEDPTTAGMIHGVGLRHFLYWSWYQKQETLAQLAEVVERAGMGFTVYTYPAGNAQAKDEVERLAEEQAHKNQIVLPMEVSNPDAYSIQQIPPNTQGIMALQTLIDDYFGSWIIKFILGQTLSYRAEAGTPGISDLHRDSFLQIVKYDSLGVEETVTNDLIRMLLMFNFPSYKNVNFKFKLNTEEAVPLEKLQALQAAWSMGAKIKSEDVMGLIGLNVASNTDQALYNPQVLSSLKEYEQMEKSEEPQDPAISETQDDALAAMLGPIMQAKKYDKKESDMPSIKEDLHELLLKPHESQNSHQRVVDHLSAMGMEADAKNLESSKFKDDYAGHIKDLIERLFGSEEERESEEYSKNSGRAGTRRKAERLIGYIRNQGIIPDVDVAKTGTHYITLDGPDSRVKVRVADHTDAYGTSDYTVDDIEGTYEGAKQFVADWIAKERAESDEFSEELDDFSDRKSAFKKLKQEHAGLVKQIADKHEGNIKTPDGEVWYPASIDLDKFNNADLHDPLLIDSVSEYVQRAKNTLGIESGKSEEYAKKEKSGNYKPNQGMKGNAKRGLELRKKHGKGGTSVGVARARDIMNGKDLSFSTVKRMHSFFSRHAGNEEGGEDDAGYIAWLLWGGDSGRNWARSIVESNRKSKNSKGDRYDKADEKSYEATPEDFENPEIEILEYQGLKTPQEYVDHAHNHFGQTDDIMSSNFVHPDGSMSARAEGVSDLGDQANHIRSVKKVFESYSPDTVKDAKDRGFRSVRHFQRFGSMPLVHSDETNTSYAEIRSDLTDTQYGLIEKMLEKGRKVHVSILDQTKDDEIWRGTLTSPDDVEDFKKQVKARTLEKGQPYDFDVDDYLTQSPNSAVNILRDVRVMAPNSKNPGRAPSTRDGYLYIQKVQGQFYKKLVEDTEENNKAIEDALFDEGIFALSRDSDAMGWYERTFKKAQEAYFEAFPELEGNRGDLAVFNAIMMFTSNGASVDANHRIALDIYDQYRKSESKEVNEAYKFEGKESNTHREHAQLVNTLVTMLGSTEAFADFMEKEFEVTELQQMFPRTTKALGELVGTKVRGSNIFGPKLGSFYNNLNQNHETVTMDRWFTRTYKRIMGSLTDVNESALESQLDRLELRFKEHDRVDKDGNPIEPGQYIGKGNYETKQGELLSYASIRGGIKDLRDNTDIDTNSPVFKYLQDRFSRFSKSNFTDKTEENRAAKNVYENVFGLADAPASGGERDRIRGIMENVRNRMEDSGFSMSMSDLQALLWYHEKRLLPHVGVVTDRQLPDDYARQARIGVDKYLGRIKKSGTEKSAPQRVQSDEPRLGLSTKNSRRELVRGSEGVEKEDKSERIEETFSDEEAYGQIISAIKDAVRSALNDKMQPDRNAMGAGPRDHSPSDFDVTNKQVNGQATSNRGTMPRQASSSMMPPSAPNMNVSTQPVSKTGMSADATRMDRGASLANMREKFMKYRKTELIEMLQPYVKADPDFSLTDAQGKKRRTSLFKADKYSLANAIAEKYEESEEYPVMGESQSPEGSPTADVNYDQLKSQMGQQKTEEGDPIEIVDVPGKPEQPDATLAEQIGDFAYRLEQGLENPPPWLRKILDPKMGILEDNVIKPTADQPEVESPDVVTPQDESQEIEELLTPDVEFAEAVNAGLEDVLTGQKSDLEDRLREGLDKYSEETLGPSGKPETLSDYYTRTIGSVDDGTTVDLETVGSMSFYTTADGETKIVYKPEGQDEDRVFTLDQLRESVNDDTYHKLADKVLQEDIKKWAGIHEKMKIIAPSDLDFIMQNVNQGARDIGMFSKDQKKKIMQAVSTGAAYWGKENGGIDVQDYQTSNEVFEAALQSVENKSASFENYIKKAGDQHGFKPSEGSSVFDNFTRATRYMMGVASSEGWRPSANKSAMENLNNAHAFLESREQAQREGARKKRKDMMWKVLGSAGAFYVASVLYMIRQSTR